MLISMCQDVTRLQFVSCAEKDNLGGKVMMAWTENAWINAMVFVPAAKAPPKAGAKWLYSPNLINEFTSLFSPISHRSMRLWTSVFFRRWASNGQVLPKASPRVYFQLKELHCTMKAYSHMNADWKVEKAQYAEFNLPTCGKIAVCQPCRDRQPLWNSHDWWWPELKMFGSMPWCSFPRQKLLPKLAQKNCHTRVWI